MDTIKYDSKLILKLVRIAYLEGVIPFECITDDNDLVDLADFMIAHGAVVLIGGGLPIDE